MENALDSSYPASVVVSIEFIFFNWVCPWGSSPLSFHVRDFRLFFDISLYVCHVGPPFEFPGDLFIIGGCVLSSEQITSRDQDVLRDGCRFGFI